MRRFVLGWKRLGHEKRWKAYIVNYADDLVICCLVQRFPVHQFHHDEGLAVVLADFVNGDDVGMVQRRSSFGLLDEASAAVGISAARFGQQFDGDQAFQARIPGLIDPAHTTLTDLFEQGEMP